MNSFENFLAVPSEWFDFNLNYQPPLAWEEFLLNPRFLRGSDFLMRWSQGVWSETGLIEAVNRTPGFLALPYGPSGTAPTDDVRQAELYMERLEAAGLGQLKRPDLLIFRKSDRGLIDRIVNDLGGIGELPFTPETDPNMQELISHAIIAVECENSLWLAKQMPYPFTGSLKSRVCCKIKL